LWYYEDATCEDLQDLSRQVLVYIVPEREEISVADQASPQQAPYVVIVGGTGASGLACWFYYLVMALFCEAQAIAIPERGHKSIGINYTRLCAEIDRRCPDKARGIILIGHSQGGLLVWWYFMEHSERVIKVAVLCAPLHGSRVGWGLKPPGPLGEMVVGSRFMAGDDGFAATTDRWAAEHAALVALRVCCIVAKNDELVQPYSSGCVVGALTFVLSGFWEHFLTPYNFKMLVQLRRFLREVEPKPAAAKSAKRPAKLPLAA
jgi:pimeloyl-ACP methyl ester carboxylesterase